jgi:hypothetical protein
LRPPPPGHATHEPPLDTWYDVFAHALFGRILRSALDYDLAYKAIGAIVLAPLTAWVLQRLINVSGGVSVTNEAIAGFLLSPTGFAFVLVAAALTLTSFYAEQAGLMHIAAGAGRGKLTRWQDALATALRPAPPAASGAVAGGHPAGGCCRWPPSRRHLFERCSAPTTSTGTSRAPAGLPTPRWPSARCWPASRR